MFNLKNNIVTVNPELLLIKEFKTIWEKDKNKDKENANKDFAYIYFKNDFKSPYRNNYPNEELHSKVSIDIYGKEIEVSDFIKQAEEKYNELQSNKSLKLLDSAERAVHQITKYLNDFNIDGIEENKKANSVMQVVKTLQELDTLTLNLSNTKNRIEKELSATKTKGDRVLGDRELPKSKRNK